MMQVASFYRQRRNLLLALVIVLFIGLLNGCRTANHSPVAASISVTLPVFSYIQSPIAATSVDFPTLEIFNSRGEMVYLGHEASENAKLLKSLPIAMGKLTVLSGKPTLSQVTESLPGLTEEERESLVRSRLPTAVSIFLENCHACTIQETALRQKPKGAPILEEVNSLLIQVSQPK